MTSHSRPWLGPLLAGFVIAGAVASLLWIADEDPGPVVTPSPERGVACPHLQQALLHERSGNEVALREAVETAARVGELALERSGQVFGRPEEVALELRALLGSGDGETQERVADLLGEAQTACRLVGS